MKLYTLVIAAHPDDAELCCSGTVAAQIAEGKQVGYIDLTLGELGTRGTPDIRAAEAAKAAKILGLSLRENLKLPDGFFRTDRESLLKVVAKIRQYQPELVLTNAITDRHPDHGRGAELVKEACFLAGLRMIETKGINGEVQPAWRPKHVLHFIQSNYIEPDIVIDISDYWDIKMEAIRAFESQFFNPASKEPETFISSEKFTKFIEARARELGHSIGVAYGEGYTVNKQIGLKSLDSLL